MTRHAWSQPVRQPYRTERTCIHCGLVKVTRHEPGERPWQEFERGEKVMQGKTPECRREARAA